MRRSWLVLLVLMAGGCERASHTPASSFNVADPDRRAQLLSGFYDVEAKGSRWAARRFAVALAPPPDAARRGGRLWLRFYLPEQQVRAIGAMTLSASIDGQPLGDRTFENGGMQEYAEDVPPGLLDTNLAPVHFSFDRATTPSTQEGRELGAVITDVGLTVK